MSVDDDLQIDEVRFDEREGLLADLIDLLRDAVESGASVGFLAPLGTEQAERYWNERFDEVAVRKRILVAARWRGRVVGSVQLALAAQPNGAHRAEVQRLLVLREQWRRGIGTALMRRLEAAARGRGRTLLVLNTRAGDPPERLYRRLGYRDVGRIPDFARNPDGTFNTTSIMYRHLDAERSPGPPI